MDKEKELFIMQILSDLHYHCTELERKEILKRILTAFCPCCGFALKTEENQKGTNGALQCVCNHMGDELELTIETPNGSFRPEMSTWSGSVPSPEALPVADEEYVIETCVGKAGDAIHSGMVVKLIPVDKG